MATAACLAERLLKPDGKRAREGKRERERAREPREGV